MRNVILPGDALTRLRAMADESVHVLVTSPPFYGLRAFGAALWFGGSAHCEHTEDILHGAVRPGQVRQTISPTQQDCAKGQNVETASCSKCGAWHGELGQEPRVGTFIEHLVEILREARRVLRSDGVAWVEMGDSYASGTRAERQRSDGVDVGTWRTSSNRRTAGREVGPKNLLLIPARLALALQDDGWIVRQEIAWEKPACLPESVTDRPTRSHSTILMLVKSASYFYDYVAIMENAATTAKPRPTARTPRDADPGSGVRSNASFHEATPLAVSKRNARSVWRFSGVPYRGRHTAVFPPGLPERCILACTSDRGACPACLAPWRRVLERPAVGKAASGTKYEPEMSAGGMAAYRQALRAQGIEVAPPPRTIGWEPTCLCGHRETVPCVVLDPFAGSGTTLMVAATLGRDYVGIEANPDYCKEIEARLAPVLRSRRLRELLDGARPDNDCSAPHAGS